jgi:hypothetical protein
MRNELSRATARHPPDAEGSRTEYVAPKAASPRNATTHPPTASGVTALHTGATRRPPRDVLRSSSPTTRRRWTKPRMKETADRTVPTTHGGRTNAPRAKISPHHPNTRITSAAIPHSTEAQRIRCASEWLTRSRDDVIAKAYPTRRNDPLCVIRTEKSWLTNPECEDF